MKELNVLLKSSCPVSGVEFNQMSDANFSNKVFNELAKALANQIVNNNHNLPIQIGVKQDLETGDYDVSMSVMLVNPEEFEIIEYFRDKYMKILSLTEEDC